MNIKGFSKLSNKAITNAVKIASALGHISIGSEHLMVALYELEECDASNILRRNASEKADMRACLASLSGTGDPTKLTSANITTELETVIRYASVCSTKLGDGCVGTEQLLASMLNAQNKTITKLLIMASINEEKTKSNCREAPSERKPELFDYEKRPKPKTIEKYTIDLTIEAVRGNLDEVLCRNKEIDRLISILTRRKKNNACLVGEPGVGKTAVAEGLALRIANGNVPEQLTGKRVMSLDVSSMVAGTKYRGDFEERFKNTISEIVKSGDIIVFIDEMHTVMGAGAAEGAIDASNILKPILSSGELQIIGATTCDEYAKYIEKDKAFERRFSKVSVEEPSAEDALKMINSQIEKLENHHKLHITAKACAAAVQLSKRYINDRFLPDKALDLIDETASNKRIVLGREFLQNERTTVISESDIAKTVSNWTGIPVQKLDKKESVKLLNLEENLKKRIIGQDDAVQAVCSAIKRSRIGLKEENKPKTAASCSAVLPGLGKPRCAVRSPSNCSATKRR